jgi:hypothetical protein
MTDPTDRIAHWGPTDTKFFGQIGLFQLIPRAIVQKANPLQQFGLNFFGYIHGRRWGGHQWHPNLHTSKRNYTYYNRKLPN